MIYMKLKQLRNSKDLLVHLEESLTFTSLVVT